MDYCWGSCTQQSVHQEKSRWLAGQFRLQVHCLECCPYSLIQLLFPANSSLRQFFSQWGVKCKCDISSCFRFFLLHRYQQQQQQDHQERRPGYGCIWTSVHVWAISSLTEKEVLFRSCVFCLCYSKASLFGKLQVQKTSFICSVIIHSWNHILW